MGYYLHIISMIMIIKEIVSAIASGNCLSYRRTFSVIVLIFTEISNIFLYELLLCENILQCTTTYKHREILCSSTLNTHYNLQRKKTLLLLIQCNKYVSPIELYDIL